MVKSQKTFWITFFLAKRCTKVKLSISNVLVLQRRFEHLNSFFENGCIANFGEAGYRLELRRRGEYQSFVT